MGKEELRKNSRIMVEPFGWRRLTWKASETPLPYRVMIAAVQVVLRRVSMVGLAKFPTGRGPCLIRIEEHMNCSRRMHDYSKRRIYKVLIWALRPTTTPCAARSRTARDWPGYETQTTPLYAARHEYGFSLYRHPRPEGEQGGRTPRGLLQ